MIEEKEINVEPKQESVDTFVKEFTLSYMKSDILMYMKRLRFKANAMSKKEYEEKTNMLKAKLISIDNDDLEGISFDKMKEFQDKLGLLPVDEDTKRQGMEATYAERIKAFEENIEEKSKFAEDKVRKWSAERNKRTKKKRDERKLKKEKITRKKENDKVKQEQKSAEKAATHKQMKQEIHEKMLEHERERQEMVEKWKRDEQELRKKKYMHNELEEKYNKKVVIPSLERKKEDLKKRREYFHSISRSEIVSHQKEYQTRLKMKLRERKNNREKWYKDIGYGEYDPSKYASKFLTEAAENEKMPIIDPRVGIKEKADKHANYAKFVREMHKPHVSSKKTEEMRRIIEFVENNGQSRGLETTGKANSVLGKKHNKSIDSAKPGRRSNSGHKSAGERPYGVSHSVHILPKRKYKPNPLIPRPKLKPKGNPDDYLLHRRVKRQAKETEYGDYKGNSTTNWDAVANSFDRKSHSHGRFDPEMKSNSDLIDNQRLQLIKMRAKQIEEDALAKEKLAGTSVKTSNEVNSMLIDSIEAKLHILKDI